MCSRMKTTTSTNDCRKKLDRVRQTLLQADAILIGAGAGLSTAAGLQYGGKRFLDNFSDFAQAYGLHDMYSAGFYPYPSMEEYWAYWSRHIYLNRYSFQPNDVYARLLRLVEHKPYFVITTNVDHCFQKAGFDEHNLFAVQGNYGLWQCSKPCHSQTYENEDAIRKMVTQQSHMRIPSALLPYCPICHAPMKPNLRIDDTFVEDDAWYRCARQYQAFLKRYTDKAIVFLELGVGYNTPSIIKYPFWRMTAQNPHATYICINLEDVMIPDEIEAASIGIHADIKEILLNSSLKDTAVC